MYFFIFIKCDSYFKIIIPLKKVTTPSSETHIESDRSSLIAIITAGFTI